MAEFRMPSLGADMDEGTVLEWRVAPGDTVHRGQIVALVETEKADIEVEVFTDGVVQELVVPVGQKVPVGTVLALIAEPGAEAAAAVAAPPPPAPAQAPSPAVTPAGRAHPPVRSPLVRHLAEERHLDLEAVSGSGPGGTVTRDDVERAAARSPRRPKISPRARRLAAEGQPAPTATPQRAESRAPGVAMRQAVGRVMAKAKREIPHYYLSMPIDLRAALDWLDARNANRSVADRVLPTALLLHAVAQAVRQHPAMNGTFDAATERHVPSERVDLAVAIALRDGGLIAPVIPDAGSLDLDGVMEALKGLVGRARRSGLRGSDLSPGSLTVTSLGDASPGSAGVAQLFPVITPPQVAAVGIGAIREQPWAVDGLLGVHPVVWISLSADHRVSDGRDGARFLATLDDLLTHPDQLGA